MLLILPNSLQIVFVKVNEDGLDSNAILCAASVLISFSLDLDPVPVNNSGQCSTVTSCLPLFTFPRLSQVLIYH